MMTRQKRWSLKNPNYNKIWKRRNREKILEKRRPKYKEEWKKNQFKRKTTYARNFQMIQDAKNKPCMDCGVQYPPFVMHFDHRDPKTKVKNVSAMCTYNVQRIKQEIDKCDVVCANCHSIRTYKAIADGRIKMFGRFHV